MNLYDQLMTLQIIEHAFDEWQEYRKLLTSYIMEQLPAESEIAIWGAGRCNDIDLSILAEYCKSIWLIDKDEAALQVALKQYGLQDNNKLKLKVCDFTTIGDATYREYADILVNEVRKKGLQTPVNQLADLAIKMLDEVAFNLKEVTVNLGEVQCDYTVMIGVHSQLVSMFDWIWQVILQTIGKEEERVRQRIITLNEEIVRKVNNTLWQSTRKQSFIGCEISRIGREGTIQGAVQALSHIDEEIRCRHVQRKDDVQLEWPFNKGQGISYQMKIQALEIIK